jgi:hypothetical protein
MGAGRKKSILKMKRRKSQVKKKNMIKKLKAQSKK